MPRDDASAGYLSPQTIASAGIFVTVVEAGSFSRAGEVLGLTQSGVSKAIARLEDRLGTRLLHRHARAFTLTDEGARLLASVRPLVRDLDQAFGQAVSASTTKSGLIRVAADMPFGHFILSPRIADFLQREANVSMEVIVRPQLGDLVTDNLDIAIRFGPLTQSGLVTRKLAETRVLTYAAPSYVTKFGAPTSPWDLASDRHNCILLLDGNTGKPYTWDFIRSDETARVNVRSRLTVADPVTRVAACRSGFGIAQALELYAAKHVADGSLVQVLPDWADETWPLFAYLPSRRQVSPRVRAFLDFVVELTRGGLVMDL